LAGLYAGTQPLAFFLGILPLILQQFPQNFGNAWFYWGFGR